MSYYKKTTTIDGSGEILNAKVVSFYHPFQDGRGYNFKYKSINIKSYLDIPLPRNFNDSEVGKVYRLSRCIYSDSNLLARRTHHSICPLTKQDIRDVTGLSRNSFALFWNKIIKSKIVKPVELNGQEFYCFNPIYFNSTTYLPLYLYIAFQDELQNHLPDWVIEKYLGMQQDTGGKQDIADCIEVEHRG